MPTIFMSPQDVTQIAAIMCLTYAQKASLPLGPFSSLLSIQSGTEQMYTLRHTIGRPHR